MWNSAEESSLGKSYINDITANEEYIWASRHVYDPSSGATTSGGIYRFNRVDRNWVTIVPEEILYGWNAIHYDAVSEKTFGVGTRAETIPSPDPTPDDDRKYSRIIEIDGNNYSVLKDLNNSWIINIDGNLQGKVLASGFFTEVTGMKAFILDKDSGWNLLWTGSVQSSSNCYSSSIKVFPNNEWILGLIELSGFTLSYTTIDSRNRGTVYPFGNVLNPPVIEGTSLDNYWIVLPNVNAVDPSIGGIKIYRHKNGVETLELEKNDDTGNSTYFLSMIRPAIGGKL
jgi:hypothetical protein